MTQMIQLQPLSTKEASLLPAVSLRLSALSVTTRVAFGAAKVRKQKEFALIVCSHSTNTV